MERFMEWWRDEPTISPALQRRIDRNNLLRDTRHRLEIELGREPTHREIWNVTHD